MDNFKIKTIRARQILDSRGNPTVEADVTLESGAFGRAAVPSGASTGSGEALELRDGGAAYGGKGVLLAVDNANSKIAKVLVGADGNDQKTVDRTMLELDGTENKSNLGANAILAVSLATAKAAASAKKIPFYKHVQEISDTAPHEMSLPMPMMNVMNGGEHADWATDFQEYMIMPLSAETMADALRMGAEVFHALKKVLQEQGYATTVGDEGGYAPKVKNGNNEPLERIKQAIVVAGYELGKDISLAMDVASSEFFDGEKYILKTTGEAKTSDDMINWYQWIMDNFPVVSVEDGLAENDWWGWQNLNARLGDKLQLVGDDLLVTNVKLLQKAIEEKACNAILIKPNQIGSLSETIDAVKLAKQNNFRTVMSHRSGETEDTTIAHLAVGLGCGEIKTGSLSRSDRIVKYNELLRIAEADSKLKLARPFIV
ncbi:MAG: phosphopyruvate hydratase [Candidatus Nomurabacteria bacterium]|nr:phosphopyruvate hydratase [Candidatus Nomurabacteria bacterium]